jgi:hypothetical protein
MGHWARLDDNNIVQEVICIKKEELDTGAWGEPSKFVKTSYNTYNGKHYTPDDNQDYSAESSTQSKACGYRFAGVGMKYDATNDVFYDPDKPYESFVWNSKRYVWEAPIPYPEDGNPETVSETDVKYYIWDEELHQSDNTKGWVQKVIAK